MRASNRSTPERPGGGMLGALVFTGLVFSGLIFSGLLGVGFAQGAQTPPAENFQTLATQLFRTLEVRAVPCPAYTLDGRNEPICGLTALAPEAFTAAFSRAAQGRLEPEGPWAEDHTVWLRIYRAQGVRYAAIYSGIAEAFNVQFIRLK